MQLCGVLLLLAVACCSLKSIFGAELENMTTCADKCDSGCKTYMIPLETCFR